MDLGSATCINRLNGNIPPPSLPDEPEAKPAAAPTTPKRKTMMIKVDPNKDKDSDSEKPSEPVNAKKPHPDLEFVYNQKKLSDREVHKVITSKQNTFKTLYT